MHQSTSSAEVLSGDILYTVNLKMTDKKNTSFIYSVGINVSAFNE